MLAFYIEDKHKKERKILKENYCPWFYTIIAI